MSGGHFDYEYYHINTYLGNFEDPEIEDIVEDVQGLMHDLEWYRSGDISREEYIYSVQEFKQKWFKANRNERLVRIINEQCDEFKNKLNELVGA